MLREHRVLHRSFPRFTDYSIDGRVIALCGKKLFEEQRHEMEGRRPQVERAFVLAGTIRGIGDETRVHIRDILTLPRALGQRHQVNISSMWNHIYDPRANYGENLKPVGIAHSHIPVGGRNPIYGDSNRDDHSLGPSGRRNETDPRRRGDVNIVQDHPQAMVGMIMTVNPEGGGTLCLFDEFGPVSFTIRGNQGAAQYLRNDRSKKVDSRLILSGGQDVPDDFDPAAIIAQETHDDDGGDAPTPAPQAPRPDADRRQGRGRTGQNDTGRRGQRDRNNPNRQPSPRNERRGRPPEDDTRNNPDRPPQNEPQRGFSASTEVARTRSWVSNLFSFAS